MPRRFLDWALLSIALGSLLIVTPYLAVRAATAHERNYELATIPPQPVVIVLDALVNSDGTLSPILKDRVDQGIALYKAHKTQRLLMSGDNSTPHYNEVAAMASSCTPIQSLRANRNLQSSPTGDIV